MTDRKISELTSITGANVDDAADELVIVDTSATETKKITRGELFKDISTDITLGDNDKAIFGAGSDLQIYHDGTNSRIYDTGAGDLRIQGTNLRLQASNGENFLYAIADSGLSLYYDNAAKLATTSTGIDVTGSVVSDGLTSQIATTGRSILATFQNSAILAAGNQATIELKNSGQSAFISAESAQVNAGVDLLFSSNNGTGTETNRMRIAENGDISFYEDTGTTPKFYWDASAERLGIGTTSPRDLLNIFKGTGQIGARFQNTATGTTSGDGSFVGLGIAGGSTNGLNLWIYESTDMAFGTANTERMRIDSSGNVGIGTTSPTRELSIGDGTGSPNIQLLASNIGNSRIEFGDTDDSDAGEIQYDHSGNFMRLFTNGSEAMRIDSSGNVGIGTSSPAYTLDVTENNSSGAIRIYDSGTGGIDTRLIAANSGNGGTGRGVAISLQPSGSSNSVEAVKLVGLQETASATANDSSFAVQVANTSGTLIERMRIDSSGNVGIGTTSPGSKLSVVGLPTSSAGLSAGDIWNDGGTLKIV